MKNFTDNVINLMKIRMEVKETTHQILKELVAEINKIMSADDQLKKLTVNNNGKDPEITVRDKKVFTFELYNVQIYVSSDDVLKEFIHPNLPIDKEKVKRIVEDIVISQMKIPIK